MSVAGYSVVGQFELERWAGAVVDASCAFRRRSRCGAFLGWPVLSSHFCPGFAPQVGQWIPNVRLALPFMTPSLCQFKARNTVHSCSTENFNLAAQRIGFIESTGGD